MNGGKEREVVEGRGQLAQVPIGWQRKVETSGVIYISPSGSVLSCLEQVKSYLLTDGTCKCGLECPLILHKVFNFDPGAVVKQRTAEDVKADEDVTKLCIHKRKLIAVATLHKSMELPPSSLTLPSPGGGTSVTSMTPTTQPRAIRSKTHEGQAECKDPFKAMMAVGQRHVSPDLCGPHQQDVYPGYSRQRLGSTEPGHKSPFRSGHGVMLSPPSQPFGDGPLSPRTDAICSPDGFVRNNPCSFPGTGSPSALHVNRRIPLSSPGVMMHSSPAAQSSCVMAGRTNMPLSPPVPNKSPVMKKPLCNYPPSMDSSRTVFHHKAPPAPAPPLPPPCALQNKQVSSEKDPLGILDPIPSKPIPSNFQPNAHSQVPMMNVNIPPAIVPLPSNLPLPTVKPGPVGHGGHMQRTQHVAASTISPSPVTSPVHMSGPVLGRMEASPQRSRSSSTSSEQGGFAIPLCGSMKVPPRSPRSSMSSPRPALPSSPSGKPEVLHQYKEMPNQLLAGMSSTLNSQHNPMYPPASGSSALQKEHPGLLGMPLNQILNQHNAASFPASSLLSAAAKAQLANQNKQVGCGGSGGGCTGGVVSSGSGVGASAGLSCPLGGADANRVVEGHNTLNPMLPPNPALIMPSGEGQSGRAALRDKLMAQQRDPLRKRKHPPNAGNHENNFFNMLKPDMAGMRTPCPSAEQIRKTSRLPPNTSMAHLLQSLSNHSSNMTRGRNTGLAGPSRTHFGEVAVPTGAASQNVRLQQRLHGQTEVMHGPRVESAVHAAQSQFPSMMNQMQTNAIGNCGPMNQSGQVPLGNHVMGHASAHFQQHGEPNVSFMLPGNSDACCPQPMTDTGDPVSQSCSIGNAPPMGGIMTATGHVYQQQMHPALHGVHRVYPYQRQGHSFSTAPYTDNVPNSNSLPCLYQDYQGCMTDSGPPGITSHSGDTGMYREAPQKLQGQGDISIVGATGGQSSAESVDAIYRAVVDAAGKGMHVTITTGVSSSTQASPVPALSAMSAFTASIGQPLSLPHAVNAVIHAPRSSEGTDSLSQSQRVRPQLPNHTRRSSEQGKNTPNDVDAHQYFRSPSVVTPRPQWDEPNHSHWRGDEFLECSTQEHSSPCSSKGERTSVMDTSVQMCPTEMTTQTHDPSDPQMDESGSLRFNHRMPAGMRERLEPTERCAQLNGMLPRSGYGEPLTGDDQSPGSSTSLEGPLLKDYTHFNGHFNGHCAPSPSDTKSLSSEEELRHPDSPSADLLHYRPRSFNVGELVWPIKGFPSWPNKLMREEHGHNPSMQMSEQAKVEPEQLKTLTHDLQALDRASKKHRKAGKLNHHLEAAIHEAMSELDKMSGSVHQDRQVKLPKTKRRKISR
ncbi:methyl-CpG-binding domain protein 5-like isoform X1 [Myxocyprinus asiaticus]|uniref:methyl-CpG-binding domain protein 5-like isoform X1 n=2 Tax=Myxocyprinus asiaticus TaxID=70543 RepID=UPI00222132DF|nr:methyl-CpG-binding domain protein 5-like isoform X1 [Myxocyprinus asiaticus]XP_051562603.1 methyl-CpG-binding domain protein 5-like isoform X1 [Myxocyprinus asiaticus]XP_051562604.1 methyl-CpG-binding domain protein 5-like isoform X1 [Myxocyprinus asiaticus]